MIFLLDGIISLNVNYGIIAYFLLFSTFFYSTNDERERENFLVFEYLSIGSMFDKGLDLN